MRGRFSPTRQVGDAIGAGRTVVRCLLSGFVDRASLRPATTHASASDTAAVSDQEPAASITAFPAVLIYELLDAHADTAQLAARLPYDPFWAAHLDYLRDLQRKGREELARCDVEVPA